MTSINTLQEQQHLLADGSARRLRSFFSRIYGEFPFYRRVFEEKNLDPHDDPIKILDQLPVLYAREYLDLQKDIFGRLKRAHFLTDCTSGTTGKKKIRFTTVRDEAAEEELCVRFFRQCGIGPHDRVVALDIDSADIYLFYGRAMKRLGVNDFTFFSVPSDFSQSLEPVLRSNPTIIVTIPSLLMRCYPKIKTLLGELPQVALRKIIYIGETMSQSFRNTLSRELGVELFSFFGSTEIGSMAGECLEHAGVHLYNDQVIPTILEPVETEDSISGQVAWTTLHFQDQPLIKYSTHDYISVSKQPCPCGLDYPLMKSVSRIEDQFVIYGHKFKYEVFHEAIERQHGPLDFLAIEVDAVNGTDLVKFMLPEYLKTHKSAILETISQTDEIQYFSKMRYLTFSLSFTPAGSFTMRKFQRVLDLRRGSEHSADQQTPIQRTILHLHRKRVEV